MRYSVDGAVGIGRYGEDAARRMRGFQVIDDKPVCGLGRRNKVTRAICTGPDVHAFNIGDQAILCGDRVDADRGGRPVIQVEFPDAVLFLTEKDLTIGFVKYTAFQLKLAELANLDFSDQLRTFTHLVGLDRPDLGHAVLISGHCVIGGADLTSTDAIGFVFLCWRVANMADRGGDRVDGKPADGIGFVIRGDSDIAAQVDIVDAADIKELKLFACEIVDVEAFILVGAEHQAVSRVCDIHPDSRIVRLVACACHGRRFDRCRDGRSVDGVNLLGRLCGAGRQKQGGEGNIAFHEHSSGAGTNRVRVGIPCVRRKIKTRGRVFTNVP